MSANEFEDGEFPPFVLPESFLNQLFDLSGSTDGNRGFVLAFVNQEGSPMVYSRSDSQIIEMGLRKAMEKFLLDSEEADHLDGRESN